MSAFPTFLPLPILSALSGILSGFGHQSFPLSISISMTIWHSHTQRLHPRFPKTNLKFKLIPATTMDASRASSSSAADPINSSSYRLFINHRGPDTKNTFATDLYRRLFERGLKPFLDQKELKVGFNFPCQILGAIRSASVHVAVFSHTYAHSQWRFDELSLMLESGAPIIPIFFQVDPADLRWTDQKEKGVYAEALHKLQMKKTVDPEIHEEKPRYDSATLQKWRKALSDVADISGFDLKGKFNGDEGLLLDQVVKRVVELMPAKTKLYVAKNPTGLDDKIEDLETSVSTATQRRSSGGGHSLLRRSRQDNFG